MIDLKHHLMNRKLLAYMPFYAPAVLLYALFFIVPVLGAFYFAFTDWNGIARTYEWIGFRNFNTMLHDSVASQAFKQTFLYTILYTIVLNVLGLAVALLLDRKIPGITLTKTIVFLPYVISPLVLGYVWSYMYDPLSGIINSGLHLIGLSAYVKPWLGIQSTVIPSIVVGIVWQYTGSTAILYLSGLKGIPSDYYEAATIDGAGALQSFRNITWPLLAPSFTVSLMLAFVGGLKIFDVIIAMTGGGPGHASDSITTYLYSQAFNANKFGYASALGVSLFIAIAVISIALTSYLRRREVAA